MERDAKHVLQERYNLTLMKYKLLRDRGIRKVWSIRTDRGEYCFKKYDAALHTYAFSFELQKYLMNKELKIPRLISGVDRLNYALDQNGGVYVLFEWIKNERPLDVNNAKDLQRGLSTLALFHRDAMGFTPSSDVNRHNRYRLLVDKENIELDKLRSLEQKISGKSRLNDHLSIIEEADLVKEKILSLLESGDLESESKKGYIAHNDFASINLLATEDETYIIDFDDVAYNFPTVDFEQIFLKTCLKRLVAPHSLITWFYFYESIFRLSPPLKRYLLYRMQMPTIYRRLLNHHTYPALVRWEKEKNHALQALLR